jgi:hypothetical protein
MSQEDQLQGAPRVLAVGLFTLLGAMSAVLEIFLVPVYVGSVIFPIALVITLVLNVFLPRAVRLLTGSTALAILPVLAWLIVVYLLGFRARPKGDVLLPGYGQAQYVAIALLLLGLTAGTFGVMWEPRRARPKVTSP